MLQPIEMKLNLPMVVANGVTSTTTTVWKILRASYEGNLRMVKTLVEKCPELIYAQYNYTPPIHLAVREGHKDVVEYLLERGALDPDYRIYPFLESLLTIAQDREYSTIVASLEKYIKDPSACKFRGDNGDIHYNRSPLEREFEKAVNQGDFDNTEKLLKQQPSLAHDNTFFWSEGVMMMMAKIGNRKMLELLLKYGAKVPNVLKWGQFYYFEREDIAAFLLDNGMNPNVMSWHHVRLLHDMAQKGNIAKAELLIHHGAGIDHIDEEYQSTPLGFAAKWGHTEMVDFLLHKKADPNKSGAPWSSPLAWSRKKGHAEIERLLLNAGV